VSTARFSCRNQLEGFEAKRELCTFGCQSLLFLKKKTKTKQTISTSWSFCVLWLHIRVQRLQRRKYRDTQQQSDDRKSKKFVVHRNSQWYDSKLPHKEKLPRKRNSANDTHMLDEDTENHRKQKNTIAVVNSK